MKKTILYLVFSCLFLMVGCTKTTETDPDSSETDPNSSETDPNSTNKTEASESYKYKGVLAGSTGHYTITLTPGSTDGKTEGTGEVKLTMDGKEHILTPDTSDKKTADWDKGSELKEAEMSNKDKSIVVQVSVKSDGTEPEVKMTATGHSNVGTATYEDFSGTDVEVFEGVSSSLTDDDKLITQQVFNLLLRPKDKKFKIVFKNDIASKLDVYYYDKGADYYANLFPAQSVEGDLSISENKYTFTYKHNVQTEEEDGTTTTAEVSNTVVLTLSSDGNTLESKPTKNNLPTLIHVLDEDGNIVNFIDTDTTHGNKIKDDAGHESILLESIKGSIVCKKIPQ